MQLDAAEDAKIRHDALEYLAFFVDPHLFKRVKGLEGDDVGGAFQIVKTSEAFDRRFQAAATGNPEIPERDDFMDYVANRVREFREANPDGDDVWMDDEVVNEPVDELIVERDL